jgi:hypothetical protein
MDFRLLVVKVSTFGGEDRWQSTGVQIGGVGSAMGVMGIWNGFDHHERDPAGGFSLKEITGNATLINSYANFLTFEWH